MTISNAFVDYYCDSIYSHSSDFFNYGAFLYPLSFYEKHGGWTTIKRIFENCSDCSSYWDALHGSYQGKGFDYESVFAEMAISNYIPQSSTLGYTHASGSYISTAWNSTTALNMGLTATLSISFTSS